MFLPRMRLVLQIEWSLVAVRYLLYFAVIILYLAEAAPFFLPNLAVAAGAAMLHNIFAHWALHSRRHNLLVSPINLLLYLGRAVLLVAITGGDRSPLAPVFLLVLAGAHVYAPYSPNSPWISLLTAAAYTFTVLGDWLFNGIDLAASNFYMNLACLAVCGWLMNHLSRLLRGVETDAAARARALASSETTLRAILDNTAEPIVVYGENEFIAEANNPACAFLNLPREQLIGRRFREFLFDDGLLGDRIAALRAHGSLHDELLAVLPGGGAERSVDMHIHSFMRDGRQFFVAMFRDITEQKNLEEAQRQAKRQLELLNMELQRVNGLRSEFYSNIARRLRSPITAILGLVEMLLGEEIGDLNEEQRGALQSCRRSALRVVDLAEESFEPAAAQAAEAAAAPAEPGD